MAKIPGWVIKVARQVEGLDTEDSSKDAEIKRLSKRELLERVAQWRFGNGDVIYSFFYWLEEIYGVSEEGIEGLSRENERLSPTKSEVEPV